MRPVATDGVAWSVDLSVTAVRPAKAADRMIHDSLEQRGIISVRATYLCECACTLIHNVDTTLCLKTGISDIYPILHLSILFPCFAT